MILKTLVVAVVPVVSTFSTLAPVTVSVSFPPPPVKKMPVGTETAPLVPSTVSVSSPASPLIMILPTLRSGVDQTRPSTVTSSKAWLSAFSASMKVSLAEVPLIVRTGLSAATTSTSASVHTPRPSVPATSTSSLAIERRIV